MKATTKVILPSAEIREGVSGNRTLTIYIPTPHPKCSDNGRSHFHVKAKHVKAQRELAFAACRSVPQVSFTWAHIHYRFVLGKMESGAYRPRDLQNACTALKGAIDGIVDARVIPDDSAAHLVNLSGEIIKEPGGQSRVEIEVREVWL